MTLGLLKYFIKCGLPVLGFMIRATLKNKSNEALTSFSFQINAAILSKAIRELLKIREQLKKFNSVSIRKDWVESSKLEQ